MAATLKCCRILPDFFHRASSAHLSSFKTVLRVLGTGSLSRNSGKSLPCPEQSVTPAPSKQSVDIAGSAGRRCSHTRNFGGGSSKFANLPISCRTFLSDDAKSSHHLDALPGAACLMCVKRRQRGSRKEVALNPVVHISRGGPWPGCSAVSLVRDEGVLHLL